MENLYLYEQFQNKSRKYFSDSEIKYYTNFWNNLHENYRNNKFFSSVWNQLISKKSLSQKQWVELEFLLKNGKSRYEAGVLPPKY
jgi:hypothetical protein